VNLEGRHAGVLANGALVIAGEIDILGDDRERLGGAGAVGLGAPSVAHRGPDIGRQIGRRANDELQNAFKERRKHNGSV
jgi:hypothetical protein